MGNTELYNDLLADIIVYGSSTAKMNDEGMYVRIAPSDFYVSYTETKPTKEEVKRTAIETIQDQPFY